MRSRYALLVFCLLASCSFAADKAPERLIVATWNVEWMYDHELGDNRSDLSKQQSSPSAEYWQAKVAKVATAIAATKANIIALEEIEGDQTLAAIADELKKNHQLSYRYAFIQGTDRFTEQDVGILYQTGLTEYRRHEQSKEMFDSNRYYNLSKHLVSKFRWATIQSPMTLMAVHFRATEEAEAFAFGKLAWRDIFYNRRSMQAEDVVLLGDMNCEHAPGESIGDAKELVDANPAAGLVDLLKFASSENKRTHLILDKSYDRIFVSASMVEDGPGLDWVFKKIEVRKDLIVNGQSDGKEHWDNRLTMDWTELDTSDHFPVVAEFELK